MRSKNMSKSVLKPKFHLLRHDTSRHDKHMSCESWRDVLCCAVSCVLRRACSNVGDDEETVVLACKTISCFIIIYYFSSQMKLIRWLKRIMAITTLYTLQTKLRIAPVAFVVKDVSRLLYTVYSMCDTARTTVFYTKMHGIVSRDVSWRDATSGIWA